MNIIYCYIKNRKNPKSAQKKIDYLKMLELSIISINHFSSRHKIILITSRKTINNKILSLSKKYKITIKLIDLYSLNFLFKLYKRWNKMDCWDFGIGAYLKLYALINYSNFLYLDPDTVVFTDLKKLKQYKNNKIFIRYDLSLFPKLRINSGVILQRQKWLTFDDIKNYLMKNPKKTHEKLDQGILQDLLMDKITQKNSILGYLPPYFNYRDNWHFKGPIISSSVIKKILCPIGLSDKKTKCKIEIFHYGVNNNKDLDRNIFVKQFYKI